jgi:hypothetical protein
MTHAITRASQRIEAIEQYQLKKNIPLDPPSKGEYRTTLRVVLKNGIGMAPERVTPNNPTTIVTHNSPFEGGSRGMFFNQRGEIGHESIARNRVYSAAATGGV